MTIRRLEVTIIGKSKVGRSFAKVLKAGGHDVRIRGYRTQLPTLPLPGSLLVLAVRDTELVSLARALAKRGLTKPDCAVVHLAGAQSPELLAPLRPHCAGIGQAHPLLSFADPRHPPDLQGALLLLAGDSVAIRRGAQLGKALGMRPQQWPSLDRDAYHAAAALLANGAVALSAGATSLLEQAGAPKKDAARALGHLLRSVAANIETLGLPQALTGPVRRGDSATVEKHLQATRAGSAELDALSRASATAQLGLAESLGDASSGDLRALSRLLKRGSGTPGTGRIRKAKQR